MKIGNKRVILLFFIFLAIILLLYNGLTTELPESMTKEGTTCDNTYNFCELIIPNITNEKEENIINKS